ncbi:hypothetical protein EVAR_8937_1 [Eumeta japonica]|uniref:Uncharacterized protein n=1 Tax=Eumeta variegata TaxID=151549 RepID=A0A4C1U0Q2_EUMVA|nr:hypothetical protein EVAR_8937_1 [Eumeta japonica]
MGGRTSDGQPTLKSQLKVISVLRECWNPVTKIQRDDKRKSDRVFYEHNLFIAVYIFRAICPAQPSRRRVGPAEPSGSLKATRPAGAPPPAQSG